MPNWVDNSLTVTGDKGAVEAFAKLARTPHIEKFTALEDNGIVWKEETIETELSFWNFVQPTGEELESYYSGDSWYNWNVKHWGCKWNASEVDIPDQSDGYIQYTFQTPWGPPIEFFQFVTAKFPDLTFCLGYIEEQGWGGELTGSDGEVTQTEEWEIPETHADQIERVGYCHCDGWKPQYKDCPKSSEAVA